MSFSCSNSSGEATTGNNCFQHQPCTTAQEVFHLPLLLKVLPESQYCTAGGFHKTGVKLKKRTHEGVFKKGSINSYRIDSWDPTLDVSK